MLSSPIRLHNEFFPGICIFVFGTNHSLVNRHIATNQSNTIFSQSTLNCFYKQSKAMTFRGEVWVERPPLVWNSYLASGSANWSMLNWARYEHDSITFKSLQQIFTIKPECMYKKPICLQKWITTIFNL